MSQGPNGSDACIDWVMCMLWGSGIKYKNTTGDWVIYRSQQLTPPPFSSSHIHRLTGRKTEIPLQCAFNWSFHPHSTSFALSSSFNLWSSNQSWSNQMYKNSMSVRAVFICLLAFNKLVLFHIPSVALHYTRMWMCFAYRSRSPISIHFWFIAALICESLLMFFSLKWDEEGELCTFPKTPQTRYSDWLIVNKAVKLASYLSLDEQQ